MSVSGERKTALIVHPDLAMLSKYQTRLAAEEYIPIVARDLPTALLAMTQHYFDLAIVSSQLNEPGDGWPLAGVLHLVFPRSFIAVLVPGTDLMALQAAINNGVQELFDADHAPESVVAAALGALNPSAAKKPRGRAHVQ
jgi:DNA-binding NtrC family response regulator